MEHKILIFRTSVSTKQDMKRVGKVLNECSEIEKWNTDFEDWEKVLRIECRSLEATEIAAMLQKINIHVAELE